MSCMCIQEAPGQYNEDVWEALDRVLDEARRAGLKVMLSFLDNWKYIGELLSCALRCPACVQCCREFTACCAGVLLEHAGRRARTPLHLLQAASRPLAIICNWS